MLPPVGGRPADLGALINMASWRPEWAPERPDETPVESWGCRPSEDEDSPWLSLLPANLGVAQEIPDGALPEAMGLTKLAEASGAVGILPPAVAGYLSRLVVTRPSGAGSRSGGDGEPPRPRTAAGGTNQAQNVDILGEDLRQFSFSFDSTYPIQAQPGGPNQDS